MSKLHLQESWFEMKILSISIYARRCCLMEDKTSEMTKLQLYLKLEVGDLEKWRQMCTLEKWHKDIVEETDPIITGNL